MSSYSRSMSFSINSLTRTARSTSCTSSSSSSTAPSPSPAFSTLKQIGAGGQGRIWLVRQVPSGRLAVCKTVPHPALNHQGRCAEIAILESLAAHHPTHARICQLLSASATPALAQIYLEHCDAGDLWTVFEWYDYRRQRIPEAFIWHVFLSVAQALALLHCGAQQLSAPAVAGWAPIVHRDIKPHNILLQWPRSRAHDARHCYPLVKLADFGLAAFTTDPDYAPYFSGGTYAYQPPELPHGAGTPAADVWALGAVVHELVHGHPPIRVLPKGWERTAERWREWEMRGDAREVVRIREFYSQELEVALSLVLEWSPRRRVSSRELVREIERDAWYFGGRRRWMLPVEVWEGRGKGSGWR